jgi:hypothetical protein
MKHLIIGGVFLAASWNCVAQTIDDSWALSGKLRAQWDARQAADAGPLAQANALQSGTAALPDQGATAQAELHATGRNWSAIATVQQQAWSGLGGQSSSWVNELVATLDAGSWQYSLGKKIVGWDVGYAFRPNDMVQQEVRRTLVASTNEGRPLLMAEHFDAESSWSFVLVNPTSAVDQVGGQEPAVAARYYRRQGAVDWHAFARAADRTGNSLGAAMAWVASDAVELHASVRTLQGADSKAMNPLAAMLSNVSPWQNSVARNATQALIGGTWTHVSQLSVLAEAWWDGTALSADQWCDWRSRNQALQLLTSHGAPISAVAGNLAWQADAFSASSSLQRSNLYARVSWDIDAWQPSLDVLYHPTDGGRMVTAALLWKGDRVQMQGGVRVNSGPDDAVLMQLPVRRQAYLLASWAF